MLKDRIIKKTPELVQLFKTEQVVLAYLFGSQVRETAGSSSDLDLGIVFSKEVLKEDYLSTELSLGRKIDHLLDVNMTEVVNLATIKSPLLKREIVFKGACLYSADEILRLKIQTGIMKEYEDTHYLRQVQGRLIKQRLQDNSFGKKPFISPYMRKYVAHE